MLCKWLLLKQHGKACSWVPEVARDLCNASATCIILYMAAQSARSSLLTRSMYLHRTTVISAGSAACKRVADT